MARKITKPTLIKEKLDQLKLNDEIDKKEFVKEIYNNQYDYFISRSFDVNFAAAKKQLPNKIFKTIKGKITLVEIIPVPLKKHNT